MFKVISYHEIYGAKVAFMGNYGECVNYINTTPLAYYVTRHAIVAV